MLDYKKMVQKELRKRKKRQPKGFQVCVRTLAKAIYMKYGLDENFPTIPYGLYEIVVAELEKRKAVWVMNGDRNGNARGTKSTLVARIYQVSC